MTDQVARVSTKSVYGAPGHKERIVLVDFGAKSGIIRDLSKRDCDVVVVPQDATAEQIRRLAPDGVLLSNGPGDPKDVPHAVEMIAEIAWRIFRYSVFAWVINCSHLLAAQIQKN